jgi:hypothetical protein
LFISTIKAGKSFNSHLSKLIIALKSLDKEKIQYELNGFANDPYLNLNSDDNTDKTLPLWYHLRTQVYFETPTEIESREEIFVESKRSLNNIIVTGKSLKYLNYKTHLCVIKEITLYNDHHLNNDYIIKFHGYSIINCKCHLYYDYVDSNLFKYFQSNHNSSEHFYLSKWINKIKLAWGISIGVKYLHDVRIIVYFYYLNSLIYNAFKYSN